MIQAQELNAAGPLAAAASAGLLLLAAWMFARSRRNPALANPQARREAGLEFLEAAVGGPPPALALTASVFLHLIALSLIPYAGMVAPEIVIRPPRNELVLIEYRVPRGAGLDAPRQAEPASEAQSAEEPAAAASAAGDLREDEAADPPPPPPTPPPTPPAPAADYGANDVEVARFDTVIQMFPPAAPAAVALGESWEAPEFVRDWRAPRTRPGAAALAAITGLEDTAAAIARWRTLPEFAVRGRFELPAEWGGGFANAALAEYGSPIGGLPAMTGGAASLPGAARLSTAEQPGGEAFPWLRLDRQIGRRGLQYLISLLLAPRGRALAAAERGGVEAANSGGGRREMRAGSGEVPASPLERRRQGIVLVGAGARGQIPEAEGWLSGNPIYTVYVSVPGSGRKWVLQFCRPGAETRRLEPRNGVIRPRARRRLDPPFARRAEPLRLGTAGGGGWERAVVSANLDSAGGLSDLALVAGPGGESGERILANLRAWEFLPAVEDGKPVGVEAIFAIPLN